MLPSDVVIPIWGRLKIDNTELKALSVLEEETGVYIITTRHVNASEALELAMPHLIRGIANRYNIHFLGVTKIGAVWLVEWEGEDLALVYADVVAPSGEEFPIKEGAEVARITLLSLVDNRRREAYIVPEGDFENKKAFLGSRE